MSVRILHVISSVDPAWGGPSEAVNMLIRNRPHDFDNEVVTLDGPDAPFLDKVQFPIYPIGHTPNRWMSFKLIPWLVKNRDRFDGIILHGLWGFTTIAMLFAIAGRKPYVIFPHGMLDPYFRKRYPLKHIKKWLFWVPFQYWVLRFARNVIFTATLEAELAEHSFWLWRWNPLVISYGADPPPVEASTILAAFYEKCPEVKGERFLLYLSRIHRKKGCDLLLAAFAKLAADAERENLHLVIAGPDPDNWRPELMRQPGYDRIAHRVHWPGMITGDAKWGAFEACDAFVLPSHQENFGIAIAEAMSRSRAVLITDKINIAGDIATDGSGLVEVDTEAGITRLLERWFALTSEERRSMAQKAFTTFETRFDMKKNTKDLFRIFDKNES